MAARRKKTGARKKTAAEPRRRRGHRLRVDVRPVDVDLEVEVDPERGKAFRGSVSHQLELDRKTRTLELHAADLRVSKPRVEFEGRTLRGRVEPHPERETVVVELPEKIGPGLARLEVSFAGKLRSDLRGLYAAQSGERAYALTQLEAADARRFFPCFDEPAMKARFALTVVTARAHQVLSNQPVREVETLPEGRKRVHFERTPRLSSYLLALAVGAFEASEPTRCGKTEIRVWHVPGKGHLTAFALETARETLRRLEAYFDLPYPYAKLDLLAAPDFEAGAMENAGAVFFRETLLLVDPETISLPEQKRVAEVICHELAHMWYGDLVTMAWWDDLWLNEAFATWMAFQVVDDWKPEWKMWNDFQHFRSAALGLDALGNTHPIYTPVRDPADATENFDLITYEKGASVVRMVERFLGPAPFRKGVRAYIREHALGNAVAADLWNALSRASGRDVEPVVRTWVEQEGFPALHVRRAERAGKPVLAVKQERFFASPTTRRKKADPVRWPVPVVARVGTSRGTREVRELVRRATATIPLPARTRFVYANADEGGFFRPLHDAAAMAELAGSRDALVPVERMGLLGHSWSAIRAGLAPLPPFLDLAFAFADDPDPDVLATLRAPLAFLARASADDPERRNALRARVRESFGAAFAEVGFDAGRRESLDASMRRAVLLGLVGEVAELPEVVAEAESRCERYLAERASLDPNLADAVVNLAARGGDAMLYQRLLKQADAARTPQERRRMLLALTEFRDPARVRETLELCLGDRVGTQDVALLLTRAFGNPAAREATWSFLRKRWKTLRRRLPPMLVTRPIEATPALGTRRHRREVAAFFRANPVPTGARAIKQALERFDADLELHERLAPALAAWLGVES